MRNIGVRMVVDDSQKVKFQSFATAAERAAADVNNRVAVPFYRAEMALNRIGGVATRTAAVGFGILTTAVGGLTYAMAGLGKEFISVNERFTNLQITLTSALRSFKAGRDIVKELAQYTAKSPLPFQALAETVQSFSVIPQTTNRLLSQVRTGTLNRSDGFLKQALDTVSSMNVFRPDQSASSAVFAIREALGGQLRSLVRRFDIPTTLLQRSSGQSTRELQRDPDKMFDAIYKLFTDIVTPEATYQFARQPTKLLANTREQLVDIPLLRVGQGTGQLGAASPYNRLLTSAQRGFDSLTSTLGLSGGADDQFEEKFGKRIRSSLLSFFDRIEGVASNALDEILDNLGVVRNENRVERVIGGIVQGMEKLFTFAGDLATKLKDIGPSVIEIFDRIFSIAGKVFDGLLLVKDKFGATAAAGVAIASPLLLNNLGSVISLIVRDLPSALGGLKNAVSSLFTGISQSTRGIGGGLIANDPKLAAFIAGRAPGAVASSLTQRGLAGSNFGNYVSTYKDRAGDLGFDTQAYKERAYRNFVNEELAKMGGSSANRRIPGATPFSDVRSIASSRGIGSFTGFFAAGAAGAGKLNRALELAALKQYGMDDDFLKKNPGVEKMLRGTGEDLSAFAGASKEYKPPGVGAKIGAGLRSAGRTIASGVGSALTGGAIGLGIYAAFEGITYFGKKIFEVNGGLEEFTSSLKAGSEALAQNKLTSNERSFLSAGGVDIAKLTESFKPFTEQLVAAEQISKNGIPGLKTSKITAETQALLSDQLFSGEYNRLKQIDALVNARPKSLNYGQSVSGEVPLAEDSAGAYGLQVERLRQSGFLSEQNRRLISTSASNPNFRDQFGSEQGFYSKLQNAPVQTAEAFAKMLQIPVVLSEIQQVSVEGVQALKEKADELAAQNTIKQYGDILGPALLDVRRGNLDPKSSSGVLAGLFRSTDVDKYNQASRLSSFASNNVVYSDALDAAKAQSDSLNPFGLAVQEVSDLKTGTSRVLAETLSKNFSSVAAQQGGVSNFRFGDQSAGAGPIAGLGLDGQNTREEFLQGLAGTYDKVKERIAQAKDILVKEGSTLDKASKDYFTTVSKLDISQSLVVLQGVIASAFETLDNATPVTAIQRASGLLDKLPDVPPALFNQFLKQLNELLSLAGIAPQTITPVLGAESGATELARQESALQQQRQIAQARGVLGVVAPKVFPGGLKEEGEAFTLLAKAANGATDINTKLLNQAKASRDVGEALPFLGRSSFDSRTFDPSSGTADLLRRAGLSETEGGYNPADERLSRSEELAKSARLLIELSRSDNLIAGEKLKLNQMLVEVLKEQESIRRSMSMDGFFDGLAQGILTAEDQLRNFSAVGQQVGDTIKQSLGGAFYTISGDINNAGQAIRSFGIEVADMIRKIFAQKAAESLLNMAFSAFGGAFGGMFGGAGQASNTAAINYGVSGGYASGGFTGEGHKYQYAGYVHKGEYVFPQETVRRIGVPALDRVRYSTTSLPGFADGGYMPGPMPVSAGRGGGGAVNITVTVHNNGTSSGNAQGTAGYEGLAENINGMVQAFFTERLLEEQRSGGMFNPNN